MTQSSQPNSVVVAPGQGTRIALGGTVVTLRINGDNTGGTYAAMDIELAPGASASLHVHHNEDESFAVVAGTITFQLGERTEHTTAGSLIFVPRGLRHAFLNAGVEVARALIIVTPAGLEHYFEELDALLKDVGGQPDTSAVALLNQKYGLEFIAG
jgi:quercetin dioxygenase-like cupin family protein